MTCATGIVERVYLVRWEVPAAEDVQRILTEVANHHVRVGKKLYFVAVTTPESTAPDDATRRALGENLPKLLEWCESLHLVIEGKGFSATVRRAVAAGLFMVSGKRKSMFVHEDIWAALEMTDYKARKYDIVALARSRGILAAA